MSQNWFNRAGGTIARYQYGYDNDGNVLFEDDLTSGGSDHSAVYTYDALDRLTSFEEGTFNASNSSISGTPTESESWGLDSFGNWNVLTVNGTPTESTTNSQNELTAFNSNTSNQAFDDNGNVLSGSTGTVYTYNAWNQMATATVDDVETEYTYDALGRRIMSTNESTDAESQQYYSDDGQVIETNSGSVGVSGSTMASQYVWGLAYANDLVSRDTSAGSGSVTRVYAITDANFDVTGITNTSGGVLERFGYTPYGTRAVMNSSYGTVSDTYSFEVGFQGGLMDPATGLVNFDARDYDPVTGRWMEQDPTGSQYVNGPNLYQFVGGSPTNRTDPSGQFATLSSDDVSAYTGGTVAQESGSGVQPSGSAAPGSGSIGLLNGHNPAPITIPSKTGGTRPITLPGWPALFPRGSVTGSRYSSGNGPWGPVPVPGPTVTVTPPTVTVTVPPGAPKGTYVYTVTVTGSGVSYQVVVIVN